MKLRDRIILWLKPKSDLVILTKGTFEVLKKAHYEMGVNAGRIRIRDPKGRFTK